MVEKTDKGVLDLLLVFVVLIASCFAFVEIRRHQTLVLPVPTGPYAVGRMEYNWTDRSRTDPRAPQAGMKRALIVWAWYPATRVQGARVASYLPPTWAWLSDQQYGRFGQPPLPEQRLDPDA